MNELPNTQFAVQLVGPGELALNEHKPVVHPGPKQILVKTEAVGLCFSDLKLLAQFSGHVRKSEILSGLDSGVLSEIPSYVPGEAPTVPGHEVVCRVIEVGSEVKHYKAGDRYIVQADYRTLKTAGSNGAFGYNFEGGLQEYILLDERVIGDPELPDGYMIRVDDSKGDSAVALVEPWACVENSYASQSRRTLKQGGSLLLVLDDLGPSASPPSFAWLVDSDFWYWTSRDDVLEGHRIDTLKGLPNEAFDDIIYFGHDAGMIEVLNDKLKQGGIINVALCGWQIGRPVTVDVGRIHYGGTRWIGTTGSDPLESYRMIPASGEIRPNDRILIAGAGGPMGQMHVIRDLSLGVDGVQVVATDVDQHRLETVGRKVEAIGKGKAEFATSLSQALGAGEMFSYFALMAPIPVLVADAIKRSCRGAIVNIFAGIPAGVKHPLDLDVLIENQVFLFGTSGSEPKDMRAVLSKVTRGSLDTNTSVAAVSGMAGAKAGLAAVEHRTLDGKIIVYPFLHDLDLIPLAEMDSHFPSVAAKLKNGQWCKEAEEELLRVARA